MPSDDRDQKFERALAQHLRGGAAQAHCPDAETLAAYHERNLSLEEMAQWKEHISACKACQEALALVETTGNQLVEEWKDQEVPVFEAVASLPAAQEQRSLKWVAKTSLPTAPQAAGSPVPIRRRPALLRWAVPLGAVAAGVLVFIGIYEQRAEKLSQPASTQMARNQAPAEPSQTFNQRAANVPQPPAKDEQELAAEMSAQKKELTAAPAAKPTAKTKELDDRLRESRDQMVGGRPEKKTPAPSAPAPAPDIAREGPAGGAVSQNAPVVTGLPPAAPPAPAVSGGSGGGLAPRPPAHADEKYTPPAASQRVTVESAAPPVDTTSSMMKQGISGRNVSSLNAVGNGTEMILSPDNKVWWKLGAGGTVELTTDGGKKWKALETGAVSQLTSGAAPSSKVCWIAGKAGTLVLTTDRGGHWTRISTPISGDLGGVHAADANHASIWDAAKRMSYQTSDGGATWKQTANE